MQISQKLRTYIGFAKKSRSIIYGVDNFEKKHVDLILISNTLGINARKKCEKIADKNSIRIFELQRSELCEMGFEDEQIKAMAIINFQLAKAIEEQLNQEETH